ncbi:uncharacterized protein Z520_12029 [Fonsecaea multimorphosa CBS 102226]|uniref:Uncharacterized protein n=1 Tax=Fonsecaea multimorphosa CBS 102226 TaxID=1442371 RepID=A0A0D2K7F7_9EURO|nr:uncharacterized protein Z520_12029 [Fonsecaea multimorphosa CBS 102226]KIX92283.1 hypothetical protein Z520_12029 [Fonsecaea multimorphosa CBS 102226]
MGSVSSYPSQDLLQGDMPETKKGGPFAEIVESDILVNCIYLSELIPPFINKESLSSPKKQSPTLPVPGYENPPLCVISMDHLPSLLPREDSEAVSQALLPNLLQLKERKNAREWKQAEESFNEKVGTLPEAMRGAWKRITGTQPEVNGST